MTRRDDRTIGEAEQYERGFSEGRDAGYREGWHKSFMTVTAAVVQALQEGRSVLRAINSVKMQEPKP